MKALLVSAVALAMVACASNDMVRGRASINGHAEAQGFVVVGGAEVPVTSKYVLNGVGTATVQSVKPYLTLDGAWTTGVDPASSAVREEPGAVLLRPAAVAAPMPRGAPPSDACAPPPAAPKVCEGGECAPPSGWASAANPCATKAPAASPTGRPCGTPAYVGCDGTPGGNRPRPVLHEDPPAPGTGWPCNRGASVSLSAGVKTVGAAIFGIPLHVASCSWYFVKCLFTIP